MRHDNSKDELNYMLLVIQIPTVLWCMTIWRQLSSDHQGEERNKWANVLFASKALTSPEVIWWSCSFRQTEAVPAHGTDRSIQPATYHNATTAYILSSPTLSHITLLEQVPLLLQLKLSSFVMLSLVFTFRGRNRNSLLSLNIQIRIMTYTYTYIFI